MAVGPCPADKSIPVSGESGVTFGVVLSVVLAAPVLVPVLDVFPVGGISGCSGDGGSGSSSGCPGEGGMVVGGGR